jgi:hypothetical protein
MYKKFDDSLRNLLANDDYATQQLLEARNKMCDKSVTPEQWDAVRKLVSLILLYSSKNISSLAEATLLEMTYREPYMLKLWEK